jgi:diguanylate cyclase (GGDEF)-like protein
MAPGGMAVKGSYSPDLALDALLAALDEAVLIFDEALACRGAGGRVAALLGLDPRAVLDQSRADVFARLSSASPETAELFASLRERALTPERVTIDPLEIGPRTLVWTSTPLTRDGAVVGRIELARDITRQREVDSETVAMAKKLDEVSLVDPTTGLHNRRRFEEEHEREHRRAQRVWDSYALARIDIDGMGAFNTSHGRPQGDGLLRLLGEALRASRRQYDVIARWGEDDFVVLLPCIDKNAAASVMERAAAAMVSAAKEAGFTITVSAGVAVWEPPSVDSSIDVFGRASAALAAVKGSGRSAIRIDEGGKAFEDPPDND